MYLILMCHAYEICMFEICLELHFITFSNLEVNKRLFRNGYRIDIEIQENVREF